MLVVYQVTLLQNTNIGNVEKKKTPNHDKYITKNYFSTFAGTKFDKRLKRANSATNKDVNTISQHTKKKKQENYKHLSYFSGKYFF